ncbi:MULTISPECIES: hypothetical protein [unclassified Actinobaculum]|uniref:hypothetical protein n=1 Tax=unclassified Actinobaculum TaxID=2609299 RepID=UPI000D526F2F|nr:MULTISPECIES: hypothetical protein [unclassified Actinobaculum]AWE43092.1 hypothetical protein DDD63_10470 [Actinobaculum sp. 313]RTE48522.1 hypothetical protein EKN07_09145 [Actinobaculum sp. 352]
MSEPQTPTQTSALSDPAMNDTRYHITGTFIRFLFLFIATYGIAWLALHEPTFHDDTYTDATVHCVPVFKPGFGSSPNAVLRFTSEAGNARQDYLDAQPDELYSEADGMIDAAWVNGCIAARDARESLVVSLTFVACGIFFAIPKKLRIPLPIQKQSDSDDDQPTTQQTGTAPSPLMKPVAAAGNTDPTRFAPKETTTPTTTRTIEEPAQQPSGNN